MRDCECGKQIRMRAIRLKGRGFSGVAHWLEHVDGSTIQVPDVLSCEAIKPYPKDHADRESTKLKDKWENKTYDCGAAK